MTIFEDVDIFFLEGSCAVVVTELSDEKKGSCFEVVKDVAVLGSQ